MQGSIQRDNRFDWDYPATAAQGQDYVHLLAAIRRHLPASRFTLTSVLPVATLALSNLKVGALHEFLDFINVMTYDFSGPWVETVGHHAQLFTPVNPHHESASLSCQSAVSYLCMEGVPSQKIVLGIPAYGRSFLGAVNIGQRFAGHGGEHGTFLYKDLPRPGASEFVDEQVGAAYCIGGDGGFVSYDNPQTVALKARYVVMADLGGLFYWTGAGDSPGRKSLVETGFVHLHSSG
ncbi:MAG: hypothetical protein M1817_004943 [Caeruleum heppii]|nr:MAG: hypothetical protein M1817_004943 [Caeruleum heppii]